MLELLREFGHDPTVRVAAALVVLDVLLGVIAAVKAGIFRLVVFSDFLRRDVLYQLVPYYGIWATVHVVGDIEIAGFQSIEELTGAALLASIGASVLGSLKELKTPIVAAMPPEIASSDPLGAKPPPA